MSRVVAALTTSRAETARDHADRRLRGRSYPVPYRRVWQKALGLVERNGRWSVVRADENEGVIEAEARTLLLRFVDDVEIRLGLDGDGRTRVDLTSESRVGSADLGTNARRIARFLRRLDRAL